MRDIKFITKGFQTTLKTNFSLTGVTDFNSKQVVITCKPAKANTGIVFLVDGVRIRSVLDNWCLSSFHTVELEAKGVRAVTVEHILSAFYAMGIDNVLIELVGDNQLPIFDGSSYQFAKHIRQVGIRTLGQKRKVVEVLKPIIVPSATDDGWMLLLPASKFNMRVIIDFSGLIGYQDLRVDDILKNYYKDISRARTFFMKPFSKTRWKRFQKMFKTLPNDPVKSSIIVFDNNQYLTKLRFQNEPVRHKMLDCIGDLALLGYPLIADVITYKPGHAFTHFVTVKLLKMLDKKV